MRIYTFLLTLLLGFGTRATDFATMVESPECNAWVDSVLETLSPRQRIAQLFCPVVNPTKGEASRNTVRRYAGTLNVGGLLFRGGSIAEYAELTNLAQQAADVPVMMTLDGEWGLAMRIPETPRFPYNMALGAISDTRLLEEYGAEVARECREMGLHVDFAPDADVNLNPANPVIGRRSFGEDPARVAAAVVAYSRGMERGGVLTTAKHFPGHGDTSADSHKTVPVVDHTPDFMHGNDLLPFKQYIDAGMSGIMVGHISVPSLDPDGTAASMSRAITTGLLKEQLGFRGRVFTDALEMKGAVGVHPNNCVSAFIAGADILLSSANPPADIAAIEQAIKEGDIDRSEVDSRCRKILSYKWALGLSSRPGPVNISGMKSRLNTTAAKGLIERLTAASVTVTGNKDGLLPLDHSQSVAVVSIGSDSPAMTDVMKHHGNVRTYNAGTTPLTKAQLDDIAGHDVVVAAVYNDKTSSVRQLDALPAERLVAVMFMTPYKAMAFRNTLSRAAAMVMMYDDNITARRAAGDALYGGNAVSGRLPVSMPGIAKLGDGISYPATRLSFSTPDAAGMAGWLTDSIDIIARKAVASGAFPGLQVMVVKDSRVVAERCYGHTACSSGSPAVTPATLYDLASVSKAIGTLPGIMLAVDRGLLDIDRPAGDYIDRLAGTDKACITPRQMLFHESGMPSGLNMHEIMFDPDSYAGKLTRRRRVAPHTIRVARNTWGNSRARIRRDITSTTRNDRFPIETAKGIWTGRSTRDTIMQRIYDVPLKSHSMRYSCLNFCLLAEIEQRLTGTDHDIWVEKNIFAPIGAPTLCYRPLTRYGIDRIAATENDAFLRRQTVHGHVHDELAAFSGGVQGNAGLFGSATDIAKVCQMYLQGGTYGGTRVLSNQVVREFTSTQSPTCRRGLGFDRPDISDPDRSPVPEEVPASAYGHTGFTGTCFWVDPDNNLIYVFLSNRINPSRENGAWNRNKARSRIHSLIYKALQ